MAASSSFQSLGGRSLFHDSRECSLIRPARDVSRSNPLLENDGIVNQLFGGASIGGRGESHTGGGAGDEDQGNISARVVHALEGLRKATEGDKKGSPGTRSSIGNEEALDMYLARGCNTLTVEVCPDATGKELFDALKRACGHAKSKLQQIEWPCLITNGIAYGLAALHHGGKDHTTLPGWALSVAQAVTAKPRDFDAYEMPKDDKVETKPRHPTHFATWLKQARNEISMLGSVMGLEHKKERLEALEQIEKAHEKDSDVWPENYCYSLWEELKAAWVEELRESRRRLCRLLNTDNSRKEDLKFVALAPGSGFRFPRTFDLAHPDGYYQQVCLPRQARALKGIIYGQLHHKRQAPKVGEVEGGEAKPNPAGGGGTIDDTKIGKPKDKDTKRKKEKEDKRAYPAGKRLRPKEAADSVKHGPRTKEGKPICWDAASHMGCARKDCAHDHAPISSTKGLHWTVIAQLIRRGGIRSGPIIQPGQVDGRIAQLRAQAKAENDEKVEDGMRQKQGWLPPDEYDGVQYTQLEDELRELTRGPDETWLQDNSKTSGGKVWEKRVEHPSARRRLDELKLLEEEGIFKGMDKWSNYLQSHVRGRVLNARLDGTQMGVEETLLEATEKGCRELAEEAERALADRRVVGRAPDGKCQAWVGPPTWNQVKGYGVGHFDFKCCGSEYSWKYVDYKDKLPVPQEIASALGLEANEEEERQCLVLHPCAGYLVWEGNYGVDALPTLKEVQDASRKFRSTLWDQAATVIGELGDPAPWIGNKEAELRSYAHDCLRPHHDKDYRMFQAFTVEELKGYTMQCWRVNCMNQYKVDYLIGSGPGAENNIIPFLIHGGHIRLLLPPRREDGVRLAAAMTMEGLNDCEFQCQGWREYLAQEDEAAPLVPGKRPKCPRCSDGGGKIGRAMPNVPWSFQEHPIDTQELILLGAQQPLHRRPSFAYGVRVQEVFAGSATWTAAMVEAGLEANTPIELYDDPLQKRGKRPEFDLKDPHVAESLKAEAGALPGPDTANVWEFGTPCTSYCDFNKVNGGTRSYEHPEGNNPTATEIDGNFVHSLANWARSSMTPTKSSSWSPQCLLEDTQRFGTNQRSKSCRSTQVLSSSQHTYVNGAPLLKTNRR